MKVYRITKETFEASDYTAYDRMVGQAQLANYGCVYIDEYCSPIDDEFLLEDIAAGNVAIIEERK